jgi:hypothetical protein
MVRTEPLRQFQACKGQGVKPFSRAGAQDRDIALWQSKTLVKGQRQARFSRGGIA